MITLYSSGDASDFDLDGSVLPKPQFDKLKHNVLQILTKRGNSNAAELLRATPFELIHYSNVFGDDFYLLHAWLPLPQYEGFRLLAESSKTDFTLIAETFMAWGTASSDTSVPASNGISLPLPTSIF